MNPKYCVSLETAKRLQGLGFPQTIEHGDYAYCKCCNKLHLVHEDNDEGGLCGENYSHRFYSVEWIKAHNVGELGEWLPKEIRIPYKNGRIRKWPQSLHIFHGNGWIINYVGGHSRERIDQRADTEAEARAKMLIYLAENGLLDPKALT